VSDGTLAAPNEGALATRAELDRHGHAGARAEGIVSPTSVADRADSIRPLASMILSVLGALPAPDGVTWLRYASFGMLRLRIRARLAPPR
jgi:hypothetical protein